MEVKLEAKYGITDDGHYYAIVYNTYKEVLSAAGKLDTLAEVHEYFEKWKVDKKDITPIEGNKGV